MFSIADLQKEYHSKCFQMFMQYFKELLDKNHELLDIAEGNKIFKLQGQNELLKILLRLKESRSEIKYSNKDGGFGIGV